MKFFGTLVILMLLSGLAAAVHAADFSYTYVEFVGDMSTTDNISEGAVEDGDGTSYAVRGSFEIFDSLYARVGYSREKKTFANDVIGTMLSLDSDQTFLDLGAGFHVKTGEQTSLHGEVFVLDTEVDHTVPQITPGMRGPPQVSTRVSVIEGQGIGLGGGVRHRIGERYELESRFSIARIGLDDLPHRDVPNQTQTTIAVGGKVHVNRQVSIGAFASYSRNTDPNFDDIRKIGISLRYQFPGASN